MNSLLEEMLSKYKADTVEDKRNAIKEIIQECVLCGLARAKFFDKVAFYGGTALRIFYKLDRFSEDLDFSLKVPDENFSLESYLPLLEKEMKSLGLNFNIEIKNKTQDSAITSAFAKGNTIEHYLMFYPDGEINKGINPDQLLKIKFEVDISPADFANFEIKYSLLPSPYSITLYDESSLFAGKIHAILCRDWKLRGVKGRDLYDYVFYLQKGIKVNLKNLEAKLKQTGIISQDISISIDDVKTMLNNKFESINYSRAKEDVEPFIKDNKSLEVWCAEFFKDITKNLQSI